MSYVVGIGDIEPGTILGAGRGNVSVWRATLSSAVGSVDDALALVRAVGRAAAREAPLHVSGVAVHPGGRAVDVVVVGEGEDWEANRYAAHLDAVTDEVRRDDGVRARWPALELEAAAGRVTAPPAALDFWRSAVPLWGAGGPTQAFEAGQNVYAGVADQVHALRPLAADPRPPQPTPPGPQPPPVPQGPSAPSSGARAWVPLLWFAGAAAVLWLAWPFKAVKG